jgi:hypothetical protein
MEVKSSLLETSQTFRGLNEFRSSLNSVQSLADFIYDVSREPLIHAETLRWDSSTTPATASPSVGVSNAELTRLHGIAKRRVRKRILFFNTEDGLRLRLMATTHQQKQMPLSMYCALCGHDAGTEGIPAPFEGIASHSSALYVRYIFASAPIPA